MMLNQSLKPTVYRQVCIVCETFILHTLWFKYQLTGISLIKYKSESLSSCSSYKYKSEIFSFSSWYVLCKLYINIAFIIYVNSTTFIIIINVAIVFSVTRYYNYYNSIFYCMLFSIYAKFLFSLFFLLFQKLITFSLFSIPK